jgi:hypothetical protein
MNEQLQDGGPSFRSCRCPAGKGEACPLTMNECEARTAGAHVGARVIHVIATESVRGQGTKDNPSRVVRSYFSLDGTLLAEHDPSCR